MMRLRRWGFTLIELLVVIAIIAILARSSSRPSLKRATKRARRATNLKQMGLAWTFYARTMTSGTPPRPLPATCTPAPR